MVTNCKTLILSHPQVIVCRLIIHVFCVLTALLCCQSVILAEPDYTTAPQENITLNNQQVEVFIANDTQLTPAQRTSEGIIVTSEGLNDSILKTGSGTWILNTGVTMPKEVTLNIVEGTVFANAGQEDIYGHRGDYYLQPTLVINEGATFHNSRYGSAVWNLCGEGTYEFYDDCEINISGQNVEFSGKLSNISDLGTLCVVAIKGYENSSFLFSGIAENLNDFFFTGDQGSTLTISKPHGGYLVVYNMDRHNYDRLGGRVILTGDGVMETYTSDAGGYIDGLCTLEYQVDEGIKRLPDNTDVYGGGRFVKSGAGTLQISPVEFKGENFAVAAGRLDYQGYFEASQAYSDAEGYTFFGISVEDGAILSPGVNGSNTIGSMKTSGNVLIKNGAILLFEFDSYRENPNSDSYDTLTLDINNLYYYSNDEYIEDYTAFTVVPGGLIQLEFVNDADAKKWAKKDAEYQIVFENDLYSYGVSSFTDDDYSYWLDSASRDLFKLVGKKGQGLFLVGLVEQEKPVPEPSTWALLALGVVVLFLRKRVRN